MAEGHLEKPMFSIVIPSYNDGDLAAEAVASCLEQVGGGSIEVILVDDGSTNDSVRAVAERYGHHPFVRIVRKENGGLASARNVGMNLCRGDWIVFLDADDLLEPNYLRSVYEAVANKVDQPCPDAVITPFRYFAQDVEISWRRSLFVRLFHVPSFGVSGFINRIYIRVGNCFPVSACVMSRACCTRVGRFDEALKAHEDWDYWIRLMDSGAVVVEVKNRTNASATRIRIRNGMSSDVGLMRETQLMVLARYCIRWPYALLRLEPVRMGALALRTLAGLVRCVLFGRSSNVTVASDLSVSVRR